MQQVSKLEHGARYIASEEMNYKSAPAHHKSETDPETASPGASVRGACTESSGGGEQTETGLGVNSDIHRLSAGRCQSYREVTLKENQKFSASNYVKWK